MAKKRIGRPKSLPTMDKVFEELHIEVHACERCGAKPATYRHYAGGRVLCRKRSRPYFNRYLKTLLGVLVIALITYLSL